MPTQASWNRELDKNLAAEDPDTFGNLSFPNSGLVRDRIGAEMRNQVLEEEAALAIVNEEEEEDDTRFIPPYGEKWTNAKLIDKVRELLKEKKVAYLNLAGHWVLKWKILFLSNYWNVCS